MDKDTKNNVEEVKKVRKPRVKKIEEKSIEKEPVGESNSNIDSGTLPVVKEESELNRKVCVVCGKTHNMHECYCESKLCQMKYFKSSNPNGYTDSDVRPIKTNNFTANETQIVVTPFGKKNKPIPFVKSNKESVIRN